MSKRIFISHRRNSGQATTDAILIKELVKKETNYTVFMDITEDYLGSFPKTLKTKISESNVFLLIIPKADNYDYLCDSKNWVHKEIYYALTFNDSLKKPSRIVPIVFDRNFTFPDKQKLGDIAEIADYSFVFYDTNSNDSPERVLKAIGTKQSSINKKAAAIFSIIFVVISLVVLGSVIQNSPEPIHKYKQPESIHFVENLSRFQSFNEFTDSCQNYVNEYLIWYLNSLDASTDAETNAEFNEVYIKEYCIRLIAMSYIAFNNSDLDKKMNELEVAQLIEECYNNIPEEHRYPISFKQKSQEQRTEDFNIILDKTIETLDNNPRLKSIGEEMIPVLKATVLAKMWPY